MIRKSLHHYSELNAVQFVTFRRRDSVDEYLKRINNHSELTASEKQMKIDAYCDQLDKGCYLNGDIITIVMDSLRRLEPKYYELHAVSIMPNHIHLLFQQNAELRIIMQKIKGVTARFVNKHLLRQGSSLWERGYFDKAIRDEKHFQIVYDYIKNNAIKAKLHDAKQRFYGIYD